MARVLVTEKLAQRASTRWPHAGHEVDVQGLSPEELLEVVPGAHALVIRSATKVTAAVLEAGTRSRRRRPGRGRARQRRRAGGDRARRHGRQRAESNILSAAEHAIALLLAQARNIPQAHAALVAGRWERSKWEGVELHGKTLGIVGLGRIGALIAQRALAFGMRLLAYDPYISAERARADGRRAALARGARRGVRLRHASTCRRRRRRPGSFGRDLLAKAKPGIRIINAARGGIVDEEALAEAIRDGHRRRGGARRLRQGAATHLAAVRAARGRRHAAPRRVAPRRRRTRPASRSPSRSLLALAGDFVPYRGERRGDRRLRGRAPVHAARRAARAVLRRPARGAAGPPRGRVPGRPGRRRRPASSRSRC